MVTAEAAGRGVKQAICAAIGRHLLSLLLCMLCSPVPVFAGYKVLLKSGEEIHASDYWLDRVDKSLIRLDIDGTTQRIPRDGVLYISPVADVDRRSRTAIKRITFQPKEKLAVVPAEANAPRDGEEGAAPVASASPPAEIPAAPPAPVDPLAAEGLLRDEAERIDREREAAKDAFKNSLGTSDLARRQQARQKILDLTEERSRLLEKVRAANQGTLPTWWRWSGE